MVVRKHHVNQVSLKSKFETLFILSLFLSLANTKGNKRSRTRTDSYSAGQSVGESLPRETAASVRSCPECVLNRASFVIAVRKRGGGGAMPGSGFSRGSDQGHSPAVIPSLLK